MKITPRKLGVAAAAALMLPAGIAIASQLMILVIPGCNPNPYATEGCVVGGREIGAYLVQGLLGGMFITAAAALFISAPLLIVSAAWVLIRRRASGKVA